MHPRLRFAAVAAGIALIAAGGLALREAFAPDIAYAPLDAPEGFRRAVIEGRVSGIDPFVGLREPAGPPPANLCAALFGEAAAAPVPVAVFTDVACPYCATLEAKLEVVAERSGAAEIVRREWPILSPASALAARAILAADRQGAGAAMADRLQGSAFVPTPAYLEAVAADLDLDAPRLLADMESAGVSRRLSESMALAGLFGFAGTPGLVIGRTVLEGDVPQGTLERLIAAERDAGPPPGCAPG